MILHNLASHRADYVWRRGIVHNIRRDEANAHRAHIDALTQIRSQALAAGATQDVEQIDFELIARQNWLDNHPTR